MADGTDYEIDLSTAHNEELHKVLAGYVTHARKAAGTARRGPRSRRGDGAPDTRKVREWAKAEGIDIKERGRVPAEVIEKYKAACIREQPFPLHVPEPPGIGRSPLTSVRLRGSARQCWQGLPPNSSWRLSWRSSGVGQRSAAVCAP